MKMKKVFDPSQDDAKNFLVVEKEIKDKAKKEDIPVTKAVDDYIAKLEEYRNTNDITTKDERLFDRLKQHLIRMKKRYEQKESEEAKKAQKAAKAEKKEEIWQEIQTSIESAVLDGKQGTEIEIIEKLIADIEEGNLDFEIDSKGKKQILKRLNSRINDIKAKEEEEKAEQQRREKEAQEEAERLEREKQENIMRKLQQSMAQIETIVRRESAKGKVQSKANYLLAIRNLIAGQDEQKTFKLSIEGVEKEQLLEMLDDKIKEAEKDDLYYEQVKRYTSNFEFLRENTDIINGAAGNRLRNKFTDKEAYDRFYSLRGILQTKFKDEYFGIETLLKNDKIAEADIRVLSARKEVMDKEREFKRKTGEIR